MSGSRNKQSGKAVDLGSSTIGFKFHANVEELEELIQPEKSVVDDKNNENNVEIKNSLENSELLKLDPEKNEPLCDTFRDFRSTSLGRRTASVDSTYESPFSNPIETWKKLNELKEKITKTVEEKISDLKIDKNVLSKSSRNSLLNSKENSSVSDSEDTSESSKVSEYWKDAEDSNSSPKKVLAGNAESLSSVLETTVESVKMEIKNLEAKSEIRNRKTPMKITEINNVNDIKIATASTELQSSSRDTQLLEEVESGVEADENLNPEESVGALLDPPILATMLAQNPPPGRDQIIQSNSDYWQSKFLSQAWATVLVLGCVVFFLLPMPDFLKGFIVCFILTKIWKMIKNYTFVSDDRVAAQSFHIPDYKSMPPLRVPLSRPVKGIWVNEYEKDTYDPDYYSVTHTVPAYIELENNFLRISRPKGKIQRRATYDEPDYKLPFISQRLYNISGCNVYLMPEGLTRKRLFSKKYPIVIFLKPDSLITEKRFVKGKDVEENSDISEADEKTLTASETANKSRLYIFSRCDRQKEEWYRKLLAASRMPTTPQRRNSKSQDSADEKENSDDSSTKEPCTPFETSFFDNDEVQTDEYMRYMTKFVSDEYRHEIKYSKPRSSWYRKLKTKKKENHHPQDSDSMQFRSGALDAASRKPRLSKSSDFGENLDEPEPEDPGQSFLQIQWLNAFINRILFDMFRSPYWLQKVQNKLERKLNSIRLPFYVENIEIIEMDLGKTGPIFHRVSPPYIDDRGLWFDMDVTFDGHIRLTIQTHLNLIKLQKGVQEEQDMFNSNKPDKGKKKRKELKEFSSDKISKKKGAKDLSSDSKIKKLNPSKLPSSQTIDSDHESVDEVELRDEVAQLAAIAVEESLAEQNLGEEKNYRGPSLKKKKTKRSPIYDSEIEDSAESSEDEDEEESENYLPLPNEESQEKLDPSSLPRRYPKNRRSSKRFFRVFENVAQSKYFKSMAQSKYIQRAIAGVSATKLRLTIELKSLTGILSVNVPPPPTDRFWYGFREMPNLVFSASPKIGGKSLRFVHIKNYIQKKILHELKKVMVTPNMIDFELPTSAPARSPSSLPTELPDLDDQDDQATPSE